MFSASNIRKVAVTEGIVFHTELMRLVSNYRRDPLVDEFNVAQSKNHFSETYLLNSKAEENYVRFFLRGKQLRVSNLEVGLYLASFSFPLSLCML